MGEKSLILENALATHMSDQTIGCKGYRPLESESTQNVRLEHRLLTSVSVGVAGRDVRFWNYSGSPNSRTSHAEPSVRHSEFHTIIQFGPHDLLIGEPCRYGTEHIVLSRPGVPLIKQFHDPLGDLFRCSYGHSDFLPPNARASPEAANLSPLTCGRTGDDGCASDGGLRNGSGLWTAEVPSETTQMMMNPCNE